MDNYRQRLIDEAHREAQVKIDYLKVRREEMIGTMESFLGSQESKQSTLQRPEQFLNYDTQAELLSARQDTYTRSLANLNMQLKSLDAFEQQGYAFFSDTLEQSPELRSLTTHLRSLQQKRDSLDLDMSRFVVEVEPSQGEAVTVQMEELNKVRRKIGDLDLMAAAIHAGRRHQPKSAPEDQHQASLPLLTSSTRQQNNGSDLLRHLDSMKRRHQMTENLLTSRLIYDQIRDHEIQGLDLDAASKQLHVANGQLEVFERDERQYTYIVDHIDSEEFIVSSLSGQLTDPVSVDLINQASEIMDRIANKSYYNTRELSYFDAFLQRKKKALKGHIKQKRDLIQQEVEVTNRKTHLLQRYIFDLTNQEIAVTQQQLRDTVGNRKEALDYQKLLVKKQLGELEESLSELPSKWAEEREWQMRQNMGNQMTKALTEMSEAIRINHDIESVKAGPLDRALPPLTPNPPRIAKVILFGWVWGLFIGTGLLLFLKVFTGFLSTPEAVSAAGCHVAGHLSRHRKRRRRDDLDTLRHVLAHIQTPLNKIDDREGEVPHLLLATGKGEDYSIELAKLLHLKGNRVLVIETPEVGSEEIFGEEGLLQYLDGSVPMPRIEKRGHFDLMPAGGKSPYVAELLDSKALRSLFTQLEENYDWLLIVNRSPLTSIEAQTLLYMANRIVVTLCGEKFKHLQPYLTLAREERMNREKKISFIFSDRRRER